MNTRRMNRLEELGRVDAERADTRTGKRNLREEKSRIVRELKAKGGKVKRSKDSKDLARGSEKRKRKAGSGTLGPKTEGKLKVKVVNSNKELSDLFTKPSYKKGGKVKKSFPDLTGDGKVTRADVLKGRGVFKSGGIAKRGRGCEIR